MDDSSRGLPLFLTHDCKYGERAFHNFFCRSSSPLRNSSGISRQMSFPEGCPNFVSRRAFIHSSMTKITSASSTRSCVRGVFAAGDVPAERTRMERSLLRKTFRHRSSAVLLRSTLALQTNRYVLCFLIPFSGKRLHFPANRETRLTLSGTFNNRFSEIHIQTLSSAVPSAQQPSRARLGRQLYGYVLCFC